MEVLVWSSLRIFKLVLEFKQMLTAVHHCFTTKDSTNPSISDPIVLAPFTIPQ
jgi:hypothetical protein